MRRVAQADASRPLPSRALCIGLPGRASTCRLEYRVHKRGYVKRGYVARWVMSSSRPKALGPDHIHWQRVKKGLPDRYRLFFGFAPDPVKVIVHVWFNDENTLCKAGSKSDLYEAFKRRWRAVPCRATSTRFCARLWSESAPGAPRRDRASLTEQRQHKSQPQQWQNSLT